MAKSKSALMEYNAQERERRLSELPSVLPSRSWKERKYYAEQAELEDLRKELLDLMEILDEKMISLARGFNKRMPTFVQRSLSIPVATDEGGLGTSVRPSAGQVPIGLANGTYLPGSASALSSKDVKSKTTTYGATTADEVILCDATGGAFTVTLPTPVGNTGKVFTVKKVDAGANAITLATAAGTIDGASTKSVQYQYKSLTVVSDGTNWFIIA